MGTPPGFQMSNGKWRGDGVKSSHHYKLENNIFQVKKTLEKTNFVTKEMVCLKVRTPMKAKTTKCIRISYYG